MQSEVLYFAKTMQGKLDKNQHKACSIMNPDGNGRGWGHCDINWLIYRCREELIELEEAIKQGDIDNAILECADVGNFAMMIQDNIRDLAGRK